MYSLQHSVLPNVLYQTWKSLYETAFVYVKCTQTAQTRKQDKYKEKYISNSLKQVVDVYICL